MPEYPQLINQLRARLQQPLPGRGAQERMLGRVRAMPLQTPDNARPSAVLCLLYPTDGQMNMLLIKRREDNKAHSGQVSFPGGSYDVTDADLKATALREAQEEVGVAAKDVDILGALTPLYIPVSNFNVYPYVGYASSRPVFNLSHHEVAYTLEIPINELFGPDKKVITEVTSPASPGMPLKVNAYRLADGTIIWGATAMIISELEVALND